MVSNQAVTAAHNFKNKYPRSVEIYKHMPFEEVIYYHKKASVLLSLIPGDPSKGIIAAKSYVYAAAKRPILNIPTIKNKNTPFFQDRLIQTIAISPDEVSQYLQSRFDLFMNKQSLDTDITEEEIFYLSREYQAKKLVSYLCNQFNK